MMDATTAAAGIGVLLVLMLLLIRWKWRSYKDPYADFHIKELKEPQHSESVPSNPSMQLVHRLCPHHNVVQCFEVEQKDSLDEHLDVLTRKLAEKTMTMRFCHKLLSHQQEGRLRLSKSKIRETQNEIDSLHAIDQKVKFKYREIMDNLKTDLISNEKECKKIQEQIEWVSRRRAELKDEVRQGQILYGAAAAELAINLSEMQRGRSDQHVYEKPHQLSSMSLRHRKEPQLPRSPPMTSALIKTPTTSSPSAKFITDRSE